MSSRRFKTIILVMLALVNLALLGASIPVYWQRTQRQSDLEEGLQVLMDAQQIGL